MTLTNSDGKEVAIDTTELLDTVYDDVNIVGVDDMLSYIQIPSLESGKYKLTITVPKGHWTYTRQFETCLGFKLVLEYYKHTAQIKDAEARVTGVFPAQRTDLRTNELLELHLSISDGKIQMQKNERVSLTQNVVLSQSENRFDICKLVNTLDSTVTIKPTAVSFAANRALISFDFSKSKSIKDADCFVLVCDEPGTRASLFLTAQEHKYCFSAVGVKQCNPYARAKLQDGKCVCPAPYSGDLCESCLPGSVSKMQNRHTICSTTKQELECNGFGTLVGSQCKCDKLHTGDKCQKCVNETFAYPDCSGDYLTDVTSSKYLQSFDELRREKVYTQALTQTSQFSSQCKQTDYPMSLNEIELHSQFQTGNFHIADLYQTNHNTDNVIQFKPKTQGMFKILVKQPETSEEQSETFDIQIGVFQGKKLLDQEQNHEVRVSQDGFTGRLDYASLELEISQELVGQPLLVFFRSQNFTTTGNEADCQQLYIEIQFQHKETQGSCPSSSSYLPEFERKLTQLNWNQPQVLESLHTSQVESEVIYWQDFHIAKDSDFVLNLEQKFMEHKTLVPLIEILAENVRYSEFSYQMHDAPQPQCKLDCAFIGHKSYNKFGLQTFVEANSVVRVWLVNVKTYKDVCFSFQMTVELTESIDEIKEDPRCQLIPLLSTNMDVPKYQSGDFRFTENAKVDDRGQFISRFSIKELTNVQVRGRPGNYLIQVLQSGKVIATSKSLPVNDKVQHTTPSVFALLDTGSYELHITAVKKPQCGQITLDIQFSTEDQSQYKPSPLSLLSLLTTDDQWYSYQPSLQSQQQQLGYTILLDEFIDFSGLDTQANLVMSTQGDIEFVLLRLNSNHVYYPHSVSQGVTQKVLVEQINPDTKLRLILFTRNYQQRAMSKPAFFQASIKLYSLDQESIFTYLHQTKLAVHETTPQLLKCQSLSDSTPVQLIDNTVVNLQVRPDSLKYEFEFQPTTTTQTRFTIDEGYKIELVQSGKVIGVSKTINGVSELRVSTQNGGYIVRLTVNDMHSFLWNQECRVITFTTVSYPVKAPSHFGSASVQVDLTTNEQSTIIVDRSVQITMSKGGDLDISVDITSVGIPQLYLANANQQPKLTGDSKKDVVKSILDQQDSQLLTESGLFKQAYMVRYLDLDAGTYLIKLPGTYLVSVRQSRVKSIQSKVTRDNEMYQAYDIEGVSSRKLPINLNSLQFMKLESEGYLLYSDYVSVPGEIKFTVDEDQTWLRIYTENNNVQMLHKLDGVEQKNTQNRHLFNQALSKGLHTLTLKPIQATNQTLQTQITISVATPQFLKKYQEFHSEGLLACPQAQFPLALENDKSMLTDADTQAYYNYPHLRYPQSKAEQVSVTTYYFRFNETQRFYYEVGSHFLASHLTLKFSQMNREYVLAHNGKQRSNVNFIDMMVSAGDYQLRVIQYNSQVDKCGIYSMKGMFNPMTAMLMSSQKLHSGHCDVKGDYLPDIIYSALAQAKGGNEDVIGSDGAFLKVYSDVLVDTSMGQIYNHQIELEVPEKTFVQLTLMASDYQLFNIRLVTSSGTVKKAFHQDVVSTSAASVKELTLAWYVDPYQTYFIQIQHDNQASQEECHYFDLILSVTTVKYLQAKHQCSDDRESLLKVLPEKITQVPFNLTGTYQIQYPLDFETLKGSQMVTADQNNSLVIDTLIESSQEVEIKVVIWQSQALSDFVFGIYEYPDIKNEESLSSLVVQTPQYSHAKSHNLGRDLAKVSVQPNQKILLVLQERITSYTLSVLYQQNPQPLCINLGISLKITPKTKLAAALPIFTQYSFIGDAASGTSDIIRFSQSTTSIFLQYENVGSIQSEDLKESLALELLNDGKTVLTFMAASVKVSETGATLEFKPSLDSIQELVQKSKATWTVKLQVKEPFSKKFKVTQQFTEQVLSLKPAHSAVIKDEIAEKQQSVKPEPIKTVVVVKCECVHGTCKKGESKCNKCEVGWHGILCDVPNKFQKTAIIDDDTILTSVGSKITDSRINEAETYVSKPVAPPQHQPVQHVEKVSHIQEIRKDQETPVDSGLLDNITFVIVVGLIAYAVYFFRQKTLAKQEQERRRQKKNDYQGILETENEEEDHVLPLELEVINRRRPVAASTYQPQDEEMPVNQQSIENEIDNALSSDDSNPDIDLEQQPLESDDDDEFGQFI